MTLEVFIPLVFVFFMVFCYIAYLEDKFEKRIKALDSNLEDINIILGYTENRFVFGKAKSSKIEEISESLDSIESRLDNLPYAKTLEIEK